MREVVSRVAEVKFPVYGSGRELLFPGAFMTEKQAKRYGDRNIKSDLKAAGFECIVFKSDPEIHGGSYLRINYGKKFDARA